MSLSQLLSHWRAEPSIANNIIEWRHIQPRSAVMTAFPNDLHPALTDVLRRKGIESLYSHQEQTWQLAANHKNGSIVTGTVKTRAIVNRSPEAMGGPPVAATRQRSMSPTQWQLGSITGRMVIERGTTMSIPRRTGFRESRRY